MSDTSINLFKFVGMEFLYKSVRFIVYEAYYDDKLEIYLKAETIDNTQRIKVSWLELLDSISRGKAELLTSVGLYAV